MQFIVPQFIDIEPRILGPLTPRQFIILIIGLALEFIAYKLSDFSLFLVEGVIILIISGTLAFGRVNGKPIHFFFLNVFQTARKPRLRIWCQVAAKIKEKDWAKTKIKIDIEAPRKPLSTAKLSQLSLLIDTGGAYKDES
ncbi:MAG: hypothetical protein AAB465_03185 [Patescibacteria group bacterium]